MHDKMVAFSSNRVLIREKTAAAVYSISTMMCRFKSPRSLVLRFICLRH